MLHRRTAQGAAAVALLVGLLALPACTALDPSKPDPTTTAAASDDPTPTPTPTPTVDLTIPPDRPASMDMPSATAAAAAATYFVALYEYAYATGDTTTFSSMSADTCEFCQSVLTDIHDLRASAASEVGGGSTVTFAEGTEISPGQWYGATLRVEQQASTRLSASGEVIAVGESTEVDLALALSWVEGWRIDAVDVLDPGTLTPS